MSRRRLRLFAAPFLAAALLTPAITRAESRPVASAEARPLSSKQLYDRALHSTCWIVIGQVSGTGWVLDRDKKLVVTNEHVVHGSDTADVFFPTRDGSTLVRDPRHYLQKLPPHKARVIDRDSVRDLALLQLDAIPADMQSAKLAAGSPESGELLRAVGALPQGSVGLWGSISGEVRGVLRRPNANGFVIMMIESTVSINRGNSGGGVFNEVGELVGVVQSAHFGGQVHNTSMLVDVSEVSAFLKESLPLVAPPDANAYLTRGERRLREGRFDGALADLTEALKRDKKLVVAYVRRGSTLVRKGDAQTGLADLDEALNLDPDCKEGLLQRGIARRGLGKLDDALADFTSLIRLDLNSVEGYRQRALTHLAAKKGDAAVADLSRAIDLNGKDPTLLIDRARAQKSMQKFDAAIVDYKKAIELAPQQPAYVNELGLTLLSTKDYRGAAEMFARAANLSPANPVYISNLGVALESAGAFADAIVAYTEALKIAPESTAQFNAAIAWCGRGVCHRELKEYPAAVQNLTMAIRLNEKFARYWHERGLAHKAAGNERAAADDFRRAAELDPKRYGQKVAAAATSANPLVGTWSHRSQINGATMEIVARFNADGTCADVLRITGPDGRSETRENSGSYVIEGDVLKLESLKTGRTSRKLRFDGKTVTVEFAEIGMNLTFERVKG